MYTYFISFRIIYILLFRLSIVLHFVNISYCLSGDHSLYILYSLMIEIIIITNIVIKNNYSNNKDMLKKILLMIKFNTNA